MSLFSNPGHIPLATCDRRHRCIAWHFVWAQTSLWMAVSYRKHTMCLSAFPRWVFFSEMWPEMSIAEKCVVLRVRGMYCPWRQPLSSHLLFFRWTVLEGIHASRSSQQKWALTDTSSRISSYTCIFYFPASPHSFTSAYSADLFIKLHVLICLSQALLSVGPN